MANVKMFYEVAEAKFFPGLEGPKRFGRVEFDQLLGNYGASCNAPFIAFASELIEVYPGAMVVLVGRNSETWCKSFDTAIVESLFNPLSQIIGSVDVRSLYQLGRTMGLLLKEYFGAKTKHELQKNASPVYRMHYDSIRQLTRPERLLNFDLRDGWEPLCKLLGKPIPDCPFPRVNDCEAMQGRIKVVLRVRLSVLF